MKHVLSRLGIAACVLFASQATLVAPTQASDDVVMISIDNAMSSPDFQSKLDSSIKFYFGTSPHPAIERKFGDLTTNEKTNSLGKPDIVACNWAFLSGLLKFQERARQLGANAVVNIDSYYKREDVSNNTQIECHHGFLITGVALRGDFVKIH
jgi:hypothetical protein